MSTSKPTSNNRDRIAIVIDTLDGGGAERVCLDLSKYFVHNGYSVDLVICTFLGNLLDHIPPRVNLFVIEGKQMNRKSNFVCSVPKEEINWVVPKKRIPISDFLQHIVMSWPYGIYAIPSRRGKRARRAHAFSIYVERYQPNIVIASLPTAVYSALIGRDISTISVPVICSYHSSPLASIPRKRKLNSVLLPKADWVHTVSNGIKKELTKLNWVDNQKITTIYNSVDKQRVLEMAKYPSGHPWVDCKVKFNHKIVLTVGRLAKEKNHPLLIRSFANIARLNNLKLIILGEGGRRNNLQSLVIKLGLAHIVSIPGWIANPFSFMRQTDVFALSSNFEGFGNVLIEALVCGCKIVSTDCPHGPREILDEGRFGKLVPVDDEPAMTEAIAKSLYINPNSQALMARAEEFSPDRQVAKFEQMFNQVLGSSG